MQGVGFRYTAQHLAAGYPVAGYVRNLPGGDVELVVEGEAEGVERFLAAVAAAWPAISSTPLSLTRRRPGGRVFRYAIDLL